MTTSERPTVTVAIASVSRPDALRTSLQRIAEQTDPPEECLVIAQQQDQQTQDVAIERGIRLVIVDKPGLAYAIERGIAAANSDVIAFVDDDAEAFPDWTERIRAAYAGDPTLGLFGARDNVHADRTSGDVGLTVGRVRRGRIIGNHHLGKGQVRDVDHVKGANMSMRVTPASKIPLADLVHGDGAQARNEFILSLGIVSQGYRARYDPQLQVDHFPAQRAAGDERTRYNKARTQLIRHNETVAMVLFRSRIDRLAFVTRSALVGDRICCGLVYALALLARGDRGAIDRLNGSMTGLISGSRAAKRARRSIEAARRTR